MHVEQLAANKWMIKHLSWCVTHSLLLCAFPLLLLSLYHITFLYKIHLSLHY